MSFRIDPLVETDRGQTHRRLAWLASDSEGNPVGSAFLLTFTTAGVDHLAELEVHVHPVERRRGVGSKLLEAAAAAAQDSGRRCLISTAVEVDSPGAQFFAARGLRKVLTLTYARLALTDVDVTALAAAVDQPHPGYRLFSWDGVVPDELAETFAASRRAMDDMPMDDTDYGTQVWDVDRVRSVAEVIANRNDLLTTVAAMSGDSIAGFTELVVPGNGTGDAQHYGTAVLPEHRGHGLARWMKAELIRQARVRHPDLDGLLADTADSNVHMRAINDALGYRPTHRCAVYQLDFSSSPR